MDTGMAGARRSCRNSVGATVGIPGLIQKPGGNGYAQEGRLLVTKAFSSRPRIRLIELMQRINFGRVEDLHILGGEPQFDPPPRVLRDIKIGGDNDPRPELGMREFALRREVIEFFTHLENLGDGIVRYVEVQRGLPFKVRVEEVIA
jgi:hypothetical protein